MRLQPRGPQALYLLGTSFTPIPDLRKPTRLCCDLRNVCNFEISVSHYSRPGNSYRGKKAKRELLNLLSGLFCMLCWMAFRHSGIPAYTWFFLRGMGMFSGQLWRTNWEENEMS